MEVLKQTARHSHACKAVGGGLGAGVWRIMDGTITLHRQVWLRYKCIDSACCAILWVDADEALHLCLAKHNIPMPGK